MNILAIDTSSSWCSVAFLFSDQKAVFKHQESSFSASQLVLPWISELMESNDVVWDDVHAIAVSKGPGAFTGVRLGIGIAQGLSFAKHKPLIGVPSLDGLAAYQYFQRDPAWMDDVIALVALDARMDELYWSNYQLSRSNPPCRLGDIQLTGIDQVQSENASLFAGNGFSIYQERFIEEVLIKQAKIAKDAWIIQADATPHALGIAYAAQNLIEIQGLETLKGDCQPLYLRDKVAQTIAERESLKTS